MSKRAAFWLAWSIWALFLVIDIVDLLFPVTNVLSVSFGDIFITLVLLAFATVGSLIAARHPQNPIGWIFCISPLLLALGDVLLAYTTRAFITAPGSLPAGALAGVIGSWARSMGWFMAITFLLLLFPTGHLPSRRWRFLAWLIVGMLVVYSIALLFSPYPLSNIDPRLAAVRNPLGILVANDMFDWLANFITLPLFATSIACIVAVALRFRRARGIERQQLKWFAYGMALSLIMLIVIIFLIFFTTANGAGAIFFYLALVSIPISAGIAMLRYRLYDIDILINRTLVYGLLTAILAALYFGLVLGLQFLFDRVAGAAAATSPDHPCRLYPCHSCPLPTSSAQHPGHHRSPFLPPQIRCQAYRRQF